MLLNCLKENFLCMYVNNITFALCSFYLEIKFYFLHVPFCLNITKKKNQIFCKINFTTKYTYACLLLSYTYRYLYKNLDICNISTITFYL